MGKAKDAGEDRTAIGALTRGISRTIQAANGRRQTRTLGIEDARHMQRLLADSYLAQVRSDALAFGIDLQGLDEGLDDRPFAVAINENHRFVTASLSGLKQYGWAYPDSWKLPKDTDEQYLGEVPKAMRPSTKVTKALLVFDRDSGTAAFGARECRADCFVFPWAEILEDMNVYAARHGIGPRSSAPDNEDPGREILMDDASYTRRIAAAMRRELRECHENVGRMETIRWALFRWAKRRRPDRFRYRDGVGELFASLGTPG